jgi:ribosomal protein L22
MVAQTEVSPEGQKETKIPKVKKAKTEVKTENAKPVETVETKTDEVKTEVKTEVKKPQVKNDSVKKEMAVANAYAIPVSTKNSVAICKFIRTKTVDRAIELMELVVKKKIAVPMAYDEIPHRKRSLMPESFGGGGRFPKNAAIEFINLLGQLKANCEVNGIENPVITIAMANLASRPFRREGRRAKRTHVHLEAKDKTKLILKKFVKKLTPRRMM